MLLCDLNVSVLVIQVMCVKAAVRTCASVTDVCLLCVIRVYLCLSHENLQDVYVCLCVDMAESESTES